MKNEYGEALDRNGYAKSIIDDDRTCCHLCYTSQGKLDRHEVFHGPYRARSKEYGLWVTLCHICHMAIHHTWPEGDQRLKREGQTAAQFYYDWDTDKFIRYFGKNYLGGNDA